VGSGARRLGTAPTPRRQEGTEPAAREQRWPIADDRLEVADDAGVPPPPRTAEEVFRRYLPRVYGVARRMLGNAADAEDVTQDVLLQVVRRLDSFRGQARFTTWLDRVTVNAALAHRRSRARRERLTRAPLNELPEGSAVGPGGPRRPGPERVALDREAWALVERAVGRLSGMYRDVFVLADVEGLANAEVGGLLGLSLAAVKSRLHRARLLLRATLAPYFGVAGAPGPAALRV
jgi:RNA polymerase sigma-70 factor (ECF subfamily)